MPRKTRIPRRPNADHLKPDKFKDHLTLGELAIEVGKDRRWIRKLERAGRLPAPARYTVGELEIRLYPPSMVEEVRQIFSTMRRGRPKTGGNR